MLTTLLAGIQSALTSFIKSFVVVAVLPTMYFIGVNLLLLNKTGVWWADTAHLKSLLKVDDAKLAFTIAMLWTVAFGVTLIQSWLQEMLEGEHLPGLLRHLLHEHQVARHRGLRTIVEREVRGPAADAKAAMRNAWFAVLDELTAQHAPVTHRARRLVKALYKRRLKGEPIDDGAIEDALAALGHPPFGAAASPLLMAEARTMMHEVIVYARDRQQDRYIRAYNRMQFSFPGDVFDPDPSTDNVLAPTAFGNIGRTMRSYSIRRYGMDLDIFWSRIQKVIADSQTSKLFDTLQTQKSEVDFAVISFWFTVAIGLIWIPILAVDRTHATLFRAVAIGAPLTAWVLYEAACRAYLVFADTVRTSVDFYRFEVIRAYQLTDPPGTLEERALWERLGNLVGYARDGATFIYARKQRP